MNDPIQYTDPTGHLSEWDKKNLSKEQQKQVEQSGKAYYEALAKGDRAGMEKAHNDAEAVRNQTRNSNEYGTADGNTLTKPSSGGGSSSSSGSSGKSGGSGSSSGYGSSGNSSGTSSGISANELEFFCGKGASLVYGEDGNYRTGTVPMFKDGKIIDVDCSKAIDLRNQIGYIIMTSDTKVSGNIQNYSNLDTLNIADNSDASITNHKGGYIGTLNIGANSLTTINNRGIIETITTGKSSSLLLYNYGEINDVNIGENGTAQIYNYENAYISTIKGGDITDGTEKGMYIENRGTIGILNTGKNSRNEVTNSGSMHLIITGLKNTTTIKSNTGVIDYGGGYGRLLNSDGTVFTNSSAASTKKVKKVMILNDSDGIFNKQIQDFGHIVLMLIMEDGSGIYYSYMATNTGFTDFMLNQKSEGFLGKAELTPDQVKTFLDSDDKKSGVIRNDITAILKDKNGKFVERKISEDQTFDRYIEIEVDDSEGQKMLNYANAIYNDKKDLYQLFTHNCVQVAEQILEAGGIDFGGPPPYNNVPNAAFRWGMLNAAFNDWEVGYISRNPLHIY